MTDLQPPIKPVGVESPPYSIAIPEWASDKLTGEIARDVIRDDIQQMTEGIMSFLSDPNAPRKEPESTIAPGTYKICDDCPCCNSDCEDGSSCNLGYHQEYALMRDLKTWHTVSKDCGLARIITRDRGFGPVEISIPPNIELPKV